ncbi:MAG TPA: M50 family metallopeptidase [Pirellulales bacterium]|jgi:Zn-dependent protease|nr:M50 family metallopeptidase [Pirellulales bacterium]
MGTTLKGSVRLFRVAGIDVFVHWTWLIAAWVESSAAKRYQSPIWGVIEYLAAFGIITLHEFGHALACRQVGGKANQIVLSPLGGAALVQPPPRPGPLFWTIAAGPLVNFLLVPATVGVWFAADAAGLGNANGDAARFLLSIAVINGVLLVFNLLPIYPLDGGRILQAVLWFIIGRAWSLRIVGALGFVAGLGFVALALASGEWWSALIALFIASHSVGALRLAQIVSRTARAPRRAGFACPACSASPPQGEFWMCHKCRTQFDTFQHLALCPGCGEDFAVTQCPACQAQHPLPDWVVGSDTVEARVADRAFDGSNPCASPVDFA